MTLGKIFRYYWWLIYEFSKKHLKVILISFSISFILLISVVSITPYIQFIFPQKKEIIGLVGNCDINHLPEEILNKISNGLVYLNEKGDIIPLLINSWEKKDNGRWYRFHLKNNLIWSDGKKLEASDINYQFKDITKKAINENTIDFYLNKPLAIFPTYLTKPLVRPTLIGVGGLYRASQIKTKNGCLVSLTLIPQKKDLPIIIYKFYGSENQLITAYKKGEITKMRTTKKSIAQIFSQWKNSIVTKTVDYSRVLTFFYNNKNDLLKQKEIRQAISMAVDFTSFKDFGEIARGPIPPVSWAYNPNLKNPIFEPEMAKKIINKSIPATSSGRLYLATYYDYYDVADILLSSLKKVGLPVELKIISSEKPDRFDFLLAFWKIPTDPDQYYFWHSTQTQSNIGHYKNIKVDKLLEEARATLIRDERKKIYYEFQKIIQDDPPTLFLYYPYIYTIERQ